MNHAATPDQILSAKAEKSRRYHLRLQAYDEAIRALEEGPARYTVAEFNYRMTGLQHDRATLVAEWEKEQAQC
jgi:hypothetical protein